MMVPLWAIFKVKINFLICFNQKSQFLEVPINNFPESPDSAGRPRREVAGTCKIH
jgi:hypothetical protein